MNSVNQLNCEDQINWEDEVKNSEEYVPAYPLTEITNFAMAYLFKMKFGSSYDVYVGAVTVTDLLEDTRYEFPKYYFCKESVYNKVVDPSLTMWMKDQFSNDVVTMSTDRWVVVYENYTLVSQEELDEKMRKIWRKLPNRWKEYWFGEEIDSVSV